MVHKSIQAQVHLFIYVNVLEQPVEGSHKVTSLGRFLLHRPE